MSSVQTWTPDRAEAYFDGSLIGRISIFLAEAIGDLTARGGRREPRRGWFSRLEARLWRHEQERREAWLAQATDVFDLERRMRLLDRGRPFI
ncbi:MAG TPA: DUF3563 family protein [Casimicrobiaceae bacterium]|jgi:hypothetical protein|nr:DUF3563 family protein [Casimicrobiaceae bacterium]